MLQGFSLVAMSVTELQIAFGRVVRELRQRAGLSQEALSFACGRHRTYVSLIERGHNSPSISTVWVLASALGVAPSALVKHTEDALSGHLDSNP